MRVKRIENTSDEDVKLKLGRGLNLTLQPGASFHNVRVENLDQVKDKVKVTSDLGEICEVNPDTNKLFE